MSPVAHASAQCRIVLPRPNTCINRGAVPLDRGRRPRRPVAFIESPDPWNQRAGPGDPRRPGGLPHEFFSITDIRKTMRRCALACCGKLQFDAWRALLHWRLPICRTSPGRPESGSPCRRVAPSPARNIDAFCRCWRASLAYSVFE
jgi:hypothetical protein